MTPQLDFMMDGSEGGSPTRRLILYQLPAYKYAYRVSNCRRVGIATQQAARPSILQPSGAYLGYGPTSNPITNYLRDSPWGEKGLGADVCRHCITRSGSRRGMQAA